MQQDLDIDRVVRQRIRGLRLARGWTLDTLAARAHLSPSNLSRIETGARRIALDQLVPITKALGTTLDELIEIVKGLKEGDQIVTGSYRAISKDLENGGVVTVGKEPAPGQEGREAGNPRGA